MGRVGSRFFSVFGGLGSARSIIANVVKIRKDYVNAFKIWSHQAVKFDFTADLTTKL